MEFGRLDDLVRVLYPELRQMASRVGWRYGQCETLRATALVSETFLKLRRHPQFVDETHFLRTAALAMRQIVVNHARARIAEKRGGGAATVRLEDDLPIFWQSDEQLVALDDALVRLAEQDARMAEIVEYRFFGGYSEAEIAQMMGVTDRTVRREWVKAKALLFDAMEA